MGLGGRKGRARSALRLAGLAAIAIAIAACSSAGEDTAADAVEAPARTENATEIPPGGDPSTGETPAVSPEGGSPEPRYVDEACETKKSVCTAPPSGYGAGDGLAPIDRCAFALDESAGFGEVPALVTALEKITPRVSALDVVADGNRNAIATTQIPGSPAGVKMGFRWNAEDDDSETWIPQGITGSADADPSGKVGDRRVILASFYHAPASGADNKGARIAFVDITNPATPRYRFALLVEPKGTPEAPTFAPVKIHAGGLAWYGNYLYVVDTSRGLRAFDLSHILRVPTDVDSIGCDAATCRGGLYKYVLPQVGSYTSKSSCKPLFSFVSVDRKSDPPSLVTGEYCNATACSGPLAGRVLRWPLEKATGRLRSKKTFPTEAFLMGQTQVQGAAVRDGTFFLSSSQPAGSGGALYRVRGKKSATSRWSDSPEDLMLDGSLLWSLSEGAGARAVFAVSLASYPSP